MIIEHAAKGLHGEIVIPGDKSISHRAIMIGSLAKGTTEITNFLKGADCLSTIDCFRRMGIEIEERPASGPVAPAGRILVHGNGLYGLKAPSAMLDAGNSGTTTRLLSGILCGQNFPSTITGDASVQKRPMRRIMYPLQRMGANIASIHHNGCAPLRITPSALRGIHIVTEVASAQVKSAILFAGMYAYGITSVSVPAQSRDHTERMLTQFGAEVKTNGLHISITPDPQLTAQKIHIPGDISSAAYFLAAGLLVPGSEITVKNVGINPTRTGILKVLEQMGANLTYSNQTTLAEPAADITVRYSPLKACEISGSLIPKLIDEIPVLAVLACFADGTTIIKDAAELKVKESNRIETIVTNLKAMGADIEATEDGMVIHGGKPLHGAEIESFLDHRIAMSFAVAALAAEGQTTIRNADCVDISYPTFYESLRQLQSTTPAAN